MIEVKDKIIPATNDIVFKMLLSHKNRRKYLAMLINGLTDIPQELILKEAIFTNTELMPENINKKLYKTDLIIKIGKCFVNLEMNPILYKGLVKRNFLYQASTMSQSQLVGEEYIDVPTIIQINFNNFRVFKNNKTIARSYIMEEETHEVEIKNFVRVNINLEEISKKWYNKEDLSNIEKLCLLLVIDKINELKKVAGENKIMKEVSKALEDINKSEEFKMVWDYEEDNRKIQNTLNILARAEGHAEGHAEGKTEGYKSRNYEIAKKMVEENIDVNTISNITSLTIEEIEDLK